MKYRSNRYRTQLHNENLPDGDLTPRQLVLVNAVRNCRSIVDFSSAPKEVVTSIPVVRIALGTTAAAADLLIRRGLDQAQAEVARLRGVLAAHGVAAFMPQSEPDEAPRGEYATRKDVLVAVMKQQNAQGRVMTCAGDARIVVADGNYDPEPDQRSLPENPGDNA